MIQTIELAPYLKPTRFSAAQGVVLGLRLLAASPGDLSAPGRAAAADLRREVETLMAVSRSQIGASSGALRSLGERLAVAWVGLRYRLEGYIRATAPDRAERAERVLALALPEGTAFVKTKYPELWTFSRYHLDRFVEKGILDDVTELAGPEVVARVRELHDALGVALGIDDRQPFRAPNTRALAEQLPVVANAIVEYCRVFVGELQPSRDESLERFRLAMAPLDAHRREMNRVLRGVREDAAEAFEETQDEPLQLTPPEATEPAALASGATAEPASLPAGQTSGDE